jgi:hypothetical protein
VTRTAKPLGNGDPEVSRVPMKRLATPDDIAETIVFTGPID